MFYMYTYIVTSKSDIAIFYLFMGNKIHMSPTRGIQNVQASLLGNNTISRSSCCCSLHLMLAIDLFTKCNVLINELPSNYYEPQVTCTIYTKALQYSHHVLIKTAELSHVYYVSFPLLPQLIAKPSSQCFSPTGKIILTEIKFVSFLTRLGLD